MTMDPAPRALLADVTERARKALAGRLLALAPQHERPQLTAPIARHCRNLTEQQIAHLHVLLDHQEPP